MSDKMKAILDDRNARARLLAKSEDLVQISEQELEQTRGGASLDVAVLRTASVATVDRSVLLRTPTLTDRLNRAFVLNAGRVFGPGVVSSTNIITIVN